MHTCHNQLCVNVRHLREGTRSENSLDSTTQGRFGGRKQRKLSDDQVRALRISPHPYTTARELGVGLGIVRNIRTGRTYSEVV
jgi:hypothetical protein